MAHDFNKFPELTNSQMPFYYWDSPHEQIFRNFEAKVVKVIDGDTIKVETEFRDFVFPIRFLNTNSPEMNEDGGKESQQWMKRRLLGETIEVMVDRVNRVDKYGRLLGKIFFEGMDIGDESIRMGMATPFDNRDEGEVPEVESWLV